MRTLALTASTVTLALLATAAPAAAASTWTGATRNRTMTDSGYTRLNSPWGHWRTARVTVTDVGNQYNAGEDCHAGLTVIRRDGTTLARAVLETWTASGDSYDSNGLLFRLPGGRTQVRSSVWGTLHDATLRGHFAPVRNACRVSLTAGS